MLDAIIVGIVVAGAVLYLAWSLRPRRSQRAAVACGACARVGETRQAVPVRTRWTG